MHLNGTWYNTLGSSMKLAVEGQQVSGTYTTAVGEAQGRYPIVGAIDTESYNKSQAVGLVVIWSNEQGSSHSVTTWSGQLEMIDGQEILRATWLLTRETPPDQDWQSTLVGADIFTRYPPAWNQPDAINRRKPRSHPA